MSRAKTESEFVHERLGDDFERALSTYDTQRRVDILIDRFLEDHELRDKRVLDVGCGLGYFSQRLVERGADVLACDLGPGLVERTRERAGCEGVVADALALVSQFGASSFDVVVSSECIEHTPDPARALREMVGVLRPGGILSVSTPNTLWWPVVRLATALRVRPFDGHENFSTYRSLTDTLEGAGAVVERKYGLHLFPFQLPAHRLSTWCDGHLQSLRALMINLCVRARKSDHAAASVD